MSCCFIQKLPAFLPPFVEIVLVHSDHYGILLQNNAIKIMKQYQKRSHGEETDRNIRITLALLGYVENPSQTGVRILAVDGGGSRYAFIVGLYMLLFSIVPFESWVY